MPIPIKTNNRRRFDNSGEVSRETSPVCCRAAFGFPAVCTYLPGKYAIDGDDLYIVISEGLLRPEQEAPLEAHDRYIDVQIPLRVRGEERFGWRPRERCILPRGEFDEAADIVFFDDKPSCYVSLHPGEFVVFFPEDAHAPLIGSGNVRKAILKIRAV